jgi:hypothetical protein
MIGAIFPIALCGRSSLWCLRHASSFSQASSSDRNQCAFNRRLLEPIGNIPPAEAEERYYAMADDTPMAA